MSDERPFRRPWERPTDESNEADSDQVSEAVGSDPTGRPAEEPPSRSSEPLVDPDLTDWEAMAAGPTSLDDFSSETYAAATTEEYRGLAEEISRLKDSSFERQAVSATIAGVDSGLVGFEDVTGRRGVSEEDVEAAEQARSSDLALRVGTALGLVGLLLGSLLLGGWWFTAFVALMMVISLGEFYATVRKVGYSPLALVGLLGVVLMPILVDAVGVFSLAGTAVTATVVIVLVFSLVPRRSPLDNASITVFGMLWVGLLALVIPIAGGEDSLANIIFVGLVTAMVDISSYFVGRGFGTRALAPTLSPNKTVEGFMGGIAGGVLTAAVISTLPPYEGLGFTGSLILAAIISLVAPLGDLAESMVKRSLGVKDMGSVLPGHGGMLDRIDSFLFAVPAAYVFLVVRGLI